MNKKILYSLVALMFIVTIRIDLTDEQAEAYQGIYGSVDGVVATIDEVEAIIAKDIKGRIDTDIIASVDSEWEKLTVSEKKKKLKKGA